jgi:CHAD domain-containing protein
MGRARVRRYLAAQQAVLVATAARTASADRGGVHDARVAVRRARSTLRTFAACFRDGPVRQLDAALLAHGRRLGTVRDLEVLTEVFADWWRHDETTPPGLRGWIDTRLHEELTEVWRETVAALAAEDPAELPMRFTAVLEAASDGSAGVRKAAGRADRRARRRLASAAGDPDALHSARKAAKRARYAAEVIGADETAAQHQAVQRVLGRHHDLVIASRWLAEAPVLPVVRPDARQLGVRLESAAVDCLADLP